MADAFDRAPNEDLPARIPIRRTTLLESLTRPELGIPSNLVLDIHPSDEMFHYLVDIHDGDWDRGLAAYLYSGLRACSATEQIVTWRFGGLEDVEFLDFASGYGRVTRHLLKRIAPPNLTVSDVMERAVEFQRRLFGIRGLVSSVEPDELKTDGAFDVVQAISLFSHLPEGLFQRWLVALLKLTRPGGVLILSVHDDALRSGGRSHDRFTFVPSSENLDLDPRTYGSTWVSSEFMREALAICAPGASYHRLPRGLCGYQDVYVVVRESMVDFSGLAYNSGAEGYIDVFECGPFPQLRCAGWSASVGRERPVDRIDLLLNGSVIATCEVALPRPDVAGHFQDPRLDRCGWELTARLPVGVSYSQDAAILVAHTGEVSTILAMGSIDSLIADAARANLKAAQRTRCM